MTITTIGKVMLPPITCEKCGETISSSSASDKLKCSHCGAFYNMTTSNFKTGEVEYDFEFVEFQCVFPNFVNTCENKCPAPNMYCKKHTSDEEFDSQQKAIKYYEDCIEGVKNKLQKIEESKKIWLIEELSGIK